MKFISFISFILFLFLFEFAFSAILNYGTILQNVDTERITPDQKRMLVTTIKAVPVGTIPALNRRTIFGFDAATMSPETFTVYDEQLEKIILALDPRSIASREFIAAGSLQESYIEEADKEINNLLAEYNTLATSNPKDPSNVAITGTPGITDSAVKTNILEPVLRIYKTDIKVNPKEVFNADVAKHPKDIIEADKLYGEIKLGIKTNENSAPKGLKAAANSAIKRLENAFDNFVLSSSPTPDEKEMIEAVQQIERGCNLDDTPGRRRLFPGNTLQSIDQVYASLRSKIPIYDRDYVADKGQGELGNKMPKMRDDRFANVISSLNRAFNSRMRDPEFRTEFQNLYRNGEIFNELERIEKPGQSALQVFSSGTAPLIDGPSPEELDKRYEEKCKGATELRMNAKPGAKLWAKEATKKIGLTMDEIVKATTAPLKLSKPFATPVSPAFLDNLREIEKAQELNMFPRPQTDVPTFDVTFGTKKVNEMQKQQLENNKQLGVLCRVIFTNELMGDEYLRVVSTDNNAILAQQDPEVKSIALQILGPPSATPRPNTLDYSTLPASIEQLDLKFNTIYEALQLDNSRINYPNFLEIRKKFVRDLINDYLSISGTDPKLKSQEKNFLKELESISKETENARILGNPQNLNDPLILDSSFARRLEQVQKFDKDQGLLIFKQLKGFPIVIDEVKRKLTEAFDTLFKQIQPASNIPQIPNELRQTMADIGKDAITLLKTQTGQPQQPSTSHTGPIQIEVIERNYREFYMKRLHDKLHVNEMVQYKGLKMRAIEAFKKLNAAYLSIVPSQISPQMHPLVQSSSDSIKEIRTKDKDEDLLGPGPASLDVLDKRYKERLDSLKPLDRNVASLFGLYKAIGFTLKKLGKPYETFGAGELKVEPFLSAIASMHRIEDAIDDWKVFGQNSDFSPIDGKKLDGIYWREVATKIRAPLVYQHLGLRTRGIKALKKLNDAFDTIVERKNQMLTGQVLIFQKKLKEKNDLLLMELYGIPPPSDIRLLSDEYIRQKEGLTPPDSPEFDDYNGIKLRANWEKERLAIAFFPLASGFTNNDPEVQTSIDTANSILTNPTDTEMLKITSGNIQLKDIDEHYNNIIEEELNMNKQQIKDMKGFVAALNDYILPKLGLAYNNLIIKEVLKTTIKPEETLMLNDLNKIEMALNSEEILSDSSKGINLKSTLQNIDNFYFMRHEQIKNGRKGSIAGLPGLLKRNKRAVQRMNEAYDDLTKRDPRKLSPQKAIDLQLAIKEVENAKAPTEAFGFDPTKTIDINDLDELEKKSLDKEKAIQLLIADNDVQMLKGLKERALDAIEKLKEYKDEIIQNNILESPEQREAWSIIVKIENAKGNPLDIFELSQPINLNDLEKKRNEMISKIRPELFVDPSLSKFKVRAENAIKAIGTAYTSLLSQIQSQPSRREDPLIQKELDSEFNNKPPELRLDCDDDAYNCYDNLELCLFPAYVQVMHHRCAKTCAVCFKIGDPCVDNINIFDCRFWQSKGFCTNKAYSKGMKMKQCAFTCGLCPVGIAAVGR